MQVKENGLNLRLMSKRLQNNKEVVLAAALNNPEAFKHASEKLRNSRSFTCEVLRARKDDLVLKYAGRIPQNSKRVLLAAIEQNGLAIEWAGDMPRNSRQVVKAAVLKNYYAFMYASKRLRNSKEFILELVAVEPRISRFLSKELQEDVDVKRALSKNEENWDDVGFVFAQVLENPRLFENASDRLKGWKGFVLQLIRSHMEVVEESRRNGFPSTQYKAWIFRHFASEGLQNDKDIKSAALMRIVI